jgi:hypothetical protein
VAVVAALAVTAASAATAQRPQTRQGFWIAFGLGIGSADLTCDGCTFDRETGGAAHLRLGGTLNQQLLLGGDVTGWAKVIDGVTNTAGNVSLIAQYYPSPNGGVFLKGGAGFSTIQFIDGGEQARGDSYGVSGGVGYDIRVGRNISLTLLADLLFGGSRDIRYQGATVIPGLSFNAVNVTIGVTFH